MSSHLASHTQTQIADALGGRLPVVTRSGDPARPEDLRRVAAGDAATVLVAYPEGSGGGGGGGGGGGSGGAGIGNESGAAAALAPARASARQAAALAALKREALRRQRVIVQGDGAAAAARLDAARLGLDAVRGWQPRAALHAAGAGGASTASSTAAPAAAAELVVTSGPRRVGQILAAVAMQPGLEFVLSDLLEFEEGHAGAELVAAPAPPGLAGRPYREVRRAFASGVAIGFVGADGALRLNPKDGETGEGAAGWGEGMAQSEVGMERGINGGRERDSEQRKRWRVKTLSTPPLPPSAKKQPTVPAGARLVLLTSRQAGVKQAAAPPSAEELKLPRLRRARGGGPARRHVAVLCFDDHAASSRSLEALRDWCPRGSRVTFICA